MVRIAFDAKRLFRNFTGLGNYSRTLVGNLARWCGNDRQYVLMTERVVRNDETAEFTAPPFVIASPERGCKKLWRSWGMVREMKADKIDLYHGLSHDLPFGIRKSGIRSVVTIHDVCYRTYPKMFPLVERWIYAVKYRHSVRSADAIVAISHSTKCDIERFFDVEPSKIEVVYQALNSVFYEPTNADEARHTVAHYGVHGDFVLYVGSVNARKNLLGVLEAYARIEPSRRLPLVVVGHGSGSYAKKCQEAVVRLGLEDEVVQIENLSSMHVLKQFYTLAKFLVYPSFYEGFGLPVTEALLCGCPVVTSGVSSLPEAGGPHAVYIDPYDPNELRAAMERLLGQSAEDRAALGAKGRDWALGTFDPQALTEQVSRIYDRLLNK